MCLSINHTNLTLALIMVIFILVYNTDILEPPSGASVNLKQLKLTPL